MPTTSNFGWTTPADTDLVKDGAAAIRTLGNGIDTSFLDLKGGTTGQVLAKASNTDLDFTWATDASGIPATIFDAKGDLIAASAADTAARLAVGTNGQVLSADSSTATGLKWIAAGSAFSGAQVYNSATTQSIADSTFTILNFNVESYDTNTYHDNSTNNSRLTVPTTGYYNICSQVSFEGNTNGGRVVQLYKNGSTVLTYFSGNYGGFTSDSSFFTSINVNATAGDYFEVRVRQSSGGSLGVLGLNSTQYSFFQIQSLGA
jgi:hypothetical protein